MKITKEWLNRKEACSGGVKWFLGQDETDGSRVVKKLIGSDAEKNDWANWLTGAAARIAMQKKILSYGIKLMEEKQ